MRLRSGTAGAGMEGMGRAERRQLERQMAKEAARQGRGGSSALLVWCSQARFG